MAASGAGELIGFAYPHVLHAVIRAAYATASLPALRSG